MVLSQWDSSKFDRWRLEKEPASVSWEPLCREHRSYEAMKLLQDKRSEWNEHQSLYLTTVVSEMFSKGYRTDQIQTDTGRTLVKEATLYSAKKGVTQSMKMKTSLNLSSSVRKTQTQNEHVTKDNIPEPSSTAISAEIFPARFISGSSSRRPTETSSRPSPKHYFWCITGTKTITAKRHPTFSEKEQIRSWVSLRQGGWLHSQLFYICWNFEFFYWTIMPFTL